MAKKINTEEFIKRSKEIFGNRFLYDKTVYEKSSKKLIITCRIHGDFEIRPDNHINNKSICRECSLDARRKRKKITNENLYEEIKKLDLPKNLRYDKNFKFKRLSDKIDFYCIIHDLNYKVSIDKLIFHNNQCPECAKLKRAKSNTKSIDDVIEEFNRLYGNKYDYSKFNYINSKTNSIIICKEHGEFKSSYQDHKNGKICEKCRKKYGSLFNYNLIRYLDYRNIKYMREVILPGEYFFNKPYDFFIPELNLIIELQGEQHNKMKFNMNKNDLDKRIKIDTCKKEHAIGLGYNFIEISYEKNFNKFSENIDKVFNDYRKDI